MPLHWNRRAMAGQGPLLVNTRGRLFDAAPCGGRARQLDGQVRIAGEGAAGTLFASLPGLPGESIDELLAQALASGVRLRSGGPLHATPPAHATLVLNYATLPAATLQVAAARIAQACAAVAGRWTQAPRRRAAGAAPGGTGRE